MHPAPNPSEYQPGGDNPAKQAQAGRDQWNEDTRDKPTIQDSPRARESDIGGGRSGSDSNASKGTRG
jgi:hypothetical protein